MYETRRARGEVRDGTEEMEDHLAADGGGIDGVCEGLELRPLADAVEELDQMRQ